MKLKTSKKGTCILLIFAAVVIAPSIWLSKVPFAANDDLINVPLYFILFMLGTYYFYRVLFVLNTDVGGSFYQELFCKGKKIEFYKRVLAVLLAVFVGGVGIKGSLQMSFAIPTKFLANEPVTMEGTCYDYIHTKLKKDINYFTVEGRSEPFKLLGYPQICQIKYLENFNQDIKCKLTGREWSLGLYIDDVKCSGLKGKDVGLNRPAGPDLGS